MGANMNIADLDVDLEDLFAKTLRQEPVDLQGPLFECSLDRNQTALSSCNNLPWAERVLIAGEGMLRAAGYRPGSCRRTAGSGKIARCTGARGTTAVIFRFLFVASFGLFSASALTNLRYRRTAILTSWPVALAGGRS